MSDTRIPRARITGPYGRLVTAYARRRWGQVPDTAYVLWHSRPATRSVFGFERSIQKWHALDQHLSTYAVMASAASIGCAWCLDFGYFLAHTEGLDEAKVRQVPRWRDAEAFTPLEREVMAYAEAMSATPPTVTDEMVQGLLAQLGPAAVVELTQIVAVENQRARFNSAVGLASQGYSDACDLPLATAAPAAAG